jgi:hypothetical protein
LWSLVLKRPINSLQPSNALNPVQCKTFLFGEAQLLAALEAVLEDVVPVEDVVPEDVVLVDGSMAVVKVETICETVGIHQEKGFFAVDPRFGM